MLLCNGSARGQSPGVPAAWTVRGHLPLEQFVIQSHRGAGELAPENTIEAFEFGWKLGTWPEADVRTTKDGVIVAFHDGNFKRTVKNPPPALGNKGVKDITFAGFSQVQLHVRLNTNRASPEPFTLSRDFLRATGNELRQHGVIFQSLPWGVTEPKVYWQLMDLGVMAFATGHPDITVKAVRDYYAKP